MYAERMNKRIETIPDEMMEALRRHSWTGNIRELQNFIERTMILSTDTQLRPPLAELEEEVQDGAARVITLDDAERHHIVRALEETNWVIGGANGAAIRLGVKRTTLLAKMERLGISRP
jgi:formate hydrogenlyase transcriptional activator